MAQTPSIDVFAISRPPWLSRLSCLLRLATSHTWWCIVASWTQGRAFLWIGLQYTSRTRLADLRRVGQKIWGCYVLQNVRATHDRSELVKGRD